MKKILVSVMVLFIIPMAVSQDFRLSWSSFNMGYAVTSSSGTKIQSVVGQSFVGRTWQGNNFIESGFLADTLFRGTIVGVKEGPMLPMVYSLWQNYPNPFNPTTTIHFELPEETHVTLKVYNILGQEVMTVLDENRVAGKYDVQLDGSSLSNGVYFYRLVAKDYVATKKFILMK